MLLIFGGWKSAAHLHVCDLCKMGAGLPVCVVDTLTHVGKQLIVHA